MSAGDYLKRRNNANTDTVPNAGSDLLLLYDTAVANVGSGITYSAGTFTLGETGNFLVMVSEQIGTTSTTNNERLNAKMTFTLAGTELVEGYSTFFIRKSGGAQEYIAFSGAIINVATTTGNGDELQIRVERIDNTVGVGEEPDRIADRSGITIIKLDDNNAFGRYRSSAVITTSGTDNTRTLVNLQTQLEQESPFTRTINTIDIASTNPILCVYSLKSEDASPTGRAEYQGSLELAGSAVQGSWTQTYIRVTDNCDWGGMSGICLIFPTSGDDLDLGVISRELGGEEFEGALQLMELPSSAKTCLVEATTGDFNAAATNFAWDTNPNIDTDTFTHTLGNANVDVDVAGDYLVFVTLGSNTAAGVGGARGMPAVGVRVNTTDDESIGESSYNRASGTSDHPTLNTGGLVTGLAVNDSVYARVDRIGTVTTSMTVTAGAMALIQLTSMVAGGTSISSVSPSEHDFDNANVDINGSGFEATQATGTVYLSDASTLAGSANEVDISSAVNTWSDTLINLDYTQLSAGEVTSLHTLGPGARFIIVLTDGGEEASSAITLHRPKAIALAASTNIAASGENTTAQLTAPSGKTSGTDFDGGRIQDDENPADAVNPTLDGYMEYEWCLEAVDASVEGVQYEFRVLWNGVAADDVTVTPRLTVSAPPSGDRNRLIVT